MSVVLDLALYLAGMGTLLATYLAFSPVTRDLVMFLSRARQIRIFQQRRRYWAVGGVLLGILVVRILLGAAAAGWLWLLVPTALLLGLLFWATYVPIVMAPPAHHRLVTAVEADRLLNAEDVVLGLVMGETVRAYPRDLIARPHWFNDEIDGRPLMISYCILCNSGQAFVPEVNGRRLDLRNMTAYDNNTVYHDTLSDNFIQQLDGRVVMGPDTDAELESYPVVMAAWGAWKRLHPHTTVYFAPPVSLRDRIVDRMLRTMIPVRKLAARDRPWHLMRGPLDKRLPAMAFVFGVEISGEAVAYTVAQLQQCGVLNDEVGGEPLVALYDRARGIGQVFSRRLDGQTLEFEALDAGDDEMVIARDNPGGSLWNVAGEAIDGALAGQRLSTVAHWNQLFWFSWAAFKPATRIGASQKRPGDFVSEG